MPAWKNYEHEVAEFLRMLGYNAEVQAKVKGIGGSTHAIDVWVTFSKHGIEFKWVIDCKLWNQNVPQEKVLALKTIVELVGADRGLIFTEKGFQKGALEVARGTNITLIKSLEAFKKTAKTFFNSFYLQEQKKQTHKAAKLYTFHEGSEPHSLIYKGGILFVGNWIGQNIAFIDPKTKMVMDLIKLDNYEFNNQITKKREINHYPPGSMAVADSKLFVGQIFSEFILVIDIETHAIIKRISVPGGGEGQLVSSVDEQKIYFASNKVSNYFIIDSATYKYESIPYPGNGRGCLSLMTNPNGNKLYLGIQRGGQLDGVSYDGGNSFLAIYDLQNKNYENEIYLAEVIDGKSDDGSPTCITYDSAHNVIYVGMFQSRSGIYRIDARNNVIIDNITFEPKQNISNFPWVDPLSQAIYGEYLLSVNRNNYELVIININTKKIVFTISLGNAANGPVNIVVVEDEAIISYPKLKGLIFVDLKKWK